jgi:hypothetical protein
VDEVRPQRLPLYETRELLDAGLADSKEPPLVNLANHLQMAPTATTWVELKEMVSRFDTTAALYALKNPALSLVGVVPVVGFPVVGIPVALVCATCHVSMSDSLWWQKKKTGQKKSSPRLPVVFISLPPTHTHTTHTTDACAGRGVRGAVCVVAVCGCVC